MWKLGELLGRTSLVAQLPVLVEEGIGWLRQLADRGELKAMQRLVELFEYLGRADEAAFWRDRHARGSKPMPLTPLNQELMRALRVGDELSTRSDEDIPVLRSRAVAGDLRAMEQLGIWVDEAGQTGEAMDWLHKAADAGKYGAARELARILHRFNRDEEALTVIQRAAA
jgi:hypothetical protein